MIQRNRRANGAARSARGAARPLPRRAPLLWLPLLLALPLLWLLPTHAAAQGPDSDDPVPLMAYYYIWFDPASWNRAKTDYPLLGRYSSDDRAVMEQHVRWAKDAGIDGFIVSWKSTLKLDRRLEQLMDVAAAADFDLWIIYQGLDFERKPLPLDQIESDLAFFTDRYAQHPAFGPYERPVVIWSGTWEFTPEAIESVTRLHRDRLLILASERNVKGYLRLAAHIDGNAYYWSSVDPWSFPGYPEKLAAMSQAVHEHGGLWIAPAAPGFDARLIGGSRVVERRGGETLRVQMDAALASAPDAIALISWNEFSENSHIEPSEKYGTLALDTLAEREGVIPPRILDFDSSAPATTARSDVYGLYVLSAFFMLIASSVLVVATRK